MSSSMLIVYPEHGMHVSYFCTGCGVDEVCTLTLTLTPTRIRTPTPILTPILTLTMFQPISFNALGPPEYPSNMKQYLQSCMADGVLGVIGEGWDYAPEPEPER